MASNMDTYIDALDKVRDGVEALGWETEGGPEQADAVIALGPVFQDLVSAARMLRSDYRHGRDPYTD